MKEFTLLHADALYIRFCTLYGDKFFKPYHTERFKKIWSAEWVSGLEGIDTSLIKGALADCKANLEWPPSMAEFRRFCEKQLGIPSLEEAFQAAIRRDLTHFVVILAYEKVGSWAMKNDKADVLMKKFEPAYREALSQFRSPNVSLLAKKKTENALPPKPPLPPKIPTKTECIKFSERYEQYKKIAKEEEEKLGEQKHPVWDNKAINPHSKNFDEKLYNERKRYLICLQEELSSSLSHADRYDRIRFLRQIEASRAMISPLPLGGVPPNLKIVT